MLLEHTFGSNSNACIFLRLSPIASFQRAPLRNEKGFDLDVPHRMCCFSDACAGDNIPQRKTLHALWGKPMR